MSKEPQLSDRFDRSFALYQVECALKAANPDLDFHLVGQAHYGQVGFAFIEVHGVEDQQNRRRIRKEAGEQLQDLGFLVDLIEGKDIFHITGFPPD
jgi:hypothetical protein